MKLIVSTFLVYKVKKSLLKSGKVKEAVYQNMPKPWGIYAQSLGRRCPSRGASMPKAWGDDAQAVGTRCPSGGDTMPKAWANLAHSYICELTVVSYI